MDFFVMRFREESAVLLLCRNSVLAVNRGMCRPSVSMLFGGLPSLVMPLTEAEASGKWQARVRGDGCMHAPFFQYLNGLNVRSLLASIVPWCCGVSVWGVDRLWGRKASGTQP